ncbi:TetR family transcriptional regulator [Streptomyces sp. HNM0574]|nr:TetR/AcrR family transcriptional regulator [Streptomyces sp. HNM0574]NLU65882.1 TetR family transcriptional regulator [Streptomyces sp. HNM0574]
MTDGRRARGERKRELIITATLRIVEREGVAGVTHRSVAREAEVPASSVCYYYATLDDLLVAALTEALDAYIVELRGLLGSGRDGIEALAQLIAAAGGPERHRALAERELTLLASRRPALRPIATRWKDTVADVARGYTDDPLAVESLVATSDGLCAKALLGAENLTEREIGDVLRHSLRRGK